MRDSSSIIIEVSTIHILYLSLFYFLTLYIFIFRSLSSRFCEDIEHLTSGMFFIQVIASTYNISLVGFKLLEVSIFYYYYFFIIFLYYDNVVYLVNRILRTNSNISRNS